MNSLGTDQFQQLSSEQIAVVAKSKITALSTAQASSLTSSQILGFSTAQISALSSANLALLSTSTTVSLNSLQLETLSSIQILALKTDQLSTFTTDQIAALWSNQLNSMTSAQLIALGTSDILALGTDQISGLSSFALNALSSEQFQQFTTQQISVISNSAFTNLGTSQVSYLLTNQITGITSSQIGALTSRNFGALSTLQISTLNTLQISQITSADISGLSMAQVSAITTSDATALASAPYAKYQTLVSPLVLDLSGVTELFSGDINVLASSDLSPLASNHSSGRIQTLSLAESGVSFDLANTGNNNANVGWITPGEGFLVNLPQGVKTIDNGSELFGTATQIPGGQSASNGFAALSVFDSNNDGTIDSSDPIFSKLQVWVDTGLKGTTPVGELFSLSQLNIQSINLNASVSGTENNGNVIGLVSSFTTSNGQSHEIADVWLASTDSTGSTVNQLANLLNQYSSTGSTANLTGQGVTDSQPNENTKKSNALVSQQNSASNHTQMSSANLMASALAQYNQSAQIAGSNQMGSGPTLTSNNITNQPTDINTLTTFSNNKS